MGLTGNKRSALLPEVPTIAEAALPGYEIVGSEGLLAPAGTPREILAKLNTTITAVLNTAEMKELWASKGVEFAPNMAEQYTAKLRDEFEKTAAVIKAAGIKPD